MTLEEKKEVLAWIKLMHPEPCFIFRKGNELGEVDIDYQLKRNYGINWRYAFEIYNIDHMCITKTTHTESEMLLMCDEIITSWSRLKDVIDDDCIFAITSERINRHLREHPDQTYSLFD